MADKKAPVKKSTKVHSKRYKLYQVSGDSIKRKNPFCPKCGAGYFMAVHKNRRTCGNCHYMEKI